MGLVSHFGGLLWAGLLRTSVRRGEVPAAPSNNSCCAEAAATEHDEPKNSGSRSPRSCLGVARQGANSGEGL